MLRLSFRVYMVSAVIFSVVPFWFWSRINGVNHK